MNFSDFLEQLSNKQVDDWLNSITTDSQFIDKADPGWKYTISKNGINFPFNWLIRQLAEHYGFIGLEFGSSESSRDRFCEKFGFEVNEELIYLKKEYTLLKGFYQKLHHPEIFNHFIEYASSILNSLNINPYKIRMGIRSKTAMAIIGMRGVLYYTENKEKVYINLIVSNEFWESNKSKYKVFHVLPFEGVGNRSFVKVEINKWSDLDLDLLNNNIEQIKQEYNYIKEKKRAKWNQDAKTSNSALKFLMFKSPDINKFIESDFIVKENESVIKSNQKLNEMHPLNQILYGPPGTGKTYNTINKALAIIENKTESELKEEGRDELKKRYSDYVKSGQIVFTTFHQSMSYEDFIEGIKPIEPDKDGDQVIYRIENGIFKSFCNNARTPSHESFDQAYEKLLEEFKSVELIDLKTPKGKNFTISINRNNNLSLHTGLDKIKQGTLTKENIQKQINGEEKFIGWEGYFKGVIEYLTLKHNFKIEISSNEKNYVLIIDEINRGNVSQIFGELITLIEDDKRIGKKEEIRVHLPYSKDTEEPFGVPSNVYIIGTMNTADRSVEALDTALRRRFVFEEMPSRSDLLSPHRQIWNLWWEYPTFEWNEEPYKSAEKKLSEFLDADLESFDEGSKIWEKMKAEGKKENQIDNFNSIKINGIKLDQLLKTINKRIEILLDKDHQIGHAYLINVYSIDDLKLAFKDKIIPLLQEYFYGDIGKICLVLGDTFIMKNEKDTIKLFQSKAYDLDFETKATYVFTDPDQWDFKSIYE